MEPGAHSAHQDAISEGAAEVQHSSPLARRVAQRQQQQQHKQQQQQQPELVEQVRMGRGSVGRLAELEEARRQLARGSRRSTVFLGQGTSGAGAGVGGGLPLLML